MRHSPGSESVMRLVPPDIRYHASFLAAADEFEAVGEPVTTIKPPSTATDLATPSALAKYVRRLEAVPVVELWLVLGVEFVGRISLYTAPDATLLDREGHIGYAVRPSARRRGHASKALRAMLPIAASHGIDPALLICDSQNLASRHVIVAAGATLERELDGDLRFWAPTTHHAGR